MDPRFVRPSMRDKALSGLDSEISSILDSGDSDEIKARNYTAALARFKNYSKPPTVKRDTLPAIPPPPPPTLPRPNPPPPKPTRKRVKRAKIEPLESSPVATPVSWDRFVHPDSTHDETLWKRTLRTRTAKKSRLFDETSKKKKKNLRKTWVQY